MILLIDNYDSFTYNLYQYLGEFDEVQVFRNDQITIKEIEKKNPAAIVLSPGPKTPEEAGICVEVIRNFYKRIPILGICLGHQCIGRAFGAKVSYAKALFHGKTSIIKHNEKGIFEGADREMQVARYHSLAILEDTLPGELEITAKTEEGEIMAVQHKKYPLIGLQFHPESIHTPQGKKIIENFIKGRKISC